MLLLVLCSVNAVWADVNSDASKLVEQAEKDNAEGNTSDAENHYRQALKTAVSGAGAMSSIAGQMSRELGTFYMKQGRNSEAENYFQRAIVINANYSEALSDGEGNFSNVRTFLAQAIQRPENLPASIEMANTLSCLADLYRRTGRYADSERLLKRVIQVYDGGATASQYYTADAKNVLEQSQLNLAQVQLKEGKSTEAESSFKAFVETTRKNHGNSPKLAEALGHLAAYYKSQDRSSDADTAEAESKEIMSQFR